MNKTAILLLIGGCGIGLPSPYQQPPIGRALEAVSITVDEWANDDSLPIFGERCIDERTRLTVSTPDAETYQHHCGTCPAPPQGVRCSDYYEPGQCRYGCSASCFIYGKERWRQIPLAHLNRTPVLLIAPEYQEDLSGAVSHETLHWLSACTEHTNEWMGYDRNHEDPRLWSSEGVLSRARSRLTND